LEEDLKKEIIRSITELDLNNTVNLCKAALEKGFVMETLNSLTEGMDEIGRRYENGEYFLAELMAAGELMKVVIQMIKPYIIESGVQLGRARMIIGTVEGDIHDIGKNLVITIVSALGLDIIDLGVDVPAERFINSVKQYKPEILGMSALLTTTMPQMRRVIELLEKTGLRDTVKVIIGGRPVTREFAAEIGADAYAEDAFKARKVIIEWLKGKDYNLN
jgi:methylmalonyl-CoA mutase cobalamin-binding domain/chain